MEVGADGEDLLMKCKGLGLQLESLGSNGPAKGHVLRHESRPEGPKGGE